MDYRLQGASPSNSARKHPTVLSGELWGIAAYFNPARYPNKIAHLQLFSEHIRKQGLKLLIIEAAFANQPFEVATELAEIVISVRAEAILWQKERLLNVALNSLPQQCDKVAWLDTDILFTNQRWAEQTAELLQTYVVLQPYSHAWWTSSQHKSASCCEILRDYRACSEGSSPGAAYCEVHIPSSAEIQGHVGFAWAARRELLSNHGLYDRCIIGGADTLISAAMFGFSEYPALEFTFSSEHARDARSWMNRFYEDVKQSVSYVDGEVVHLWHGGKSGRQYFQRLMILKEAGFNPVLDIAIAASGCWRWNSNKTELHEKVKEYFWSRRDDESPER